MNLFNITITSQDKKSLNEFYSLIKNSEFYNFKCVKKLFLLKKTSKRVTLLRSPHVNKTAQEHFEKKVLTKQFQICLFRKKKYLIFLKKLNYYLFPNIKIKVTLLISKKNPNLNSLKIFTLHNYKLNKYKNCRNKNVTPGNFLGVKHSSLKVYFKVCQSLEVTDLYGEFLQSTA